MNRVFSELPGVAMKGPPGPLLNNGHLPLSGAAEGGSSVSDMLFMYCHQAESRHTWGACSIKGAEGQLNPCSPTGLALRVPT
jgi:hypothetical protein